MKEIDDFSNIFVRYDLATSRARPQAKSVGRAKQPRSSLHKVMDVVIAGDCDNIREIVQQALTEHDSLAVIREGLIKGMEEVSRLWDEGIYYLPQTLAASDAMQIGLEICESKMGKRFEKKGTVVTHTAEGDLHDLGQKIVNALLRANGYEVIDLGKDVPVEKVIEAVQQYRPVMLTGTAGLTQTAPAFERISQELRRLDIELPLVCGGSGGVTADFVNGFQFGIYGQDAAQAPLMAADAVEGKNWLEMRKKYNG